MNTPIPSLHQVKYQINEVSLSEDKICTSGKIAMASISVVSAAAAIVLKEINPLGIGSNAISGTLLPLFAGGALQHAMQSALPRNLANAQKSFLADYATPLFLITTEIYDNIPQLSDTAAHYIFEGITAFGGMCLAAFIHSLITRRLSEQEDSIPLTSGQDSQVDKLNIALLTTSTRCMVWNGVKATIGVAAIVFGSLFSQISIARDLGIIVTGEASGQILQELWLQRIIPLYRQTQENRDNLNFTPPRELGIYTIAMKILLASAHVLPGPLLISAGVVSKASNLLPLRCVLYALAGLFIGAKRHIERARFTKVPLNELSELKREPAPLNRFEQAFRVAKWIIAVGGVGGLTVLGMIGFDFDEMRIRDVSPIVRGVLGTYAASIFLSYAAAEVAKWAFRARKDSTLRNTAYFYTHYSQKIPYIGIYIMNKMLIGDISLSHDSIFQGMLASIAYADLGYAIGTEASSRGEFLSPRIFTALAAALIGKFIASELLGSV